MKLVITRRRVRSVLQWGQFTLFGAAAMALGYYVFVLADTSSYQKRERQEFNRLLQQEGDLKPPAAQTQPVQPLSKPAVIANGDLIGRIEIPRLGISTIVAEGTDESILRRAVGHIEGTALPGHPGNVGLAGHRDTCFRPLRNIRTNDIVVLDTLAGQYRYRVTCTKVVPPTDVDVLAPSGGQTLTLVTCYPFYFVGSAPDRFIVRAERIEG